MKKASLIFKLIIFSLIFNISTPLFADDGSHEPKPYDKEEIPQALQDLRRFEIITLGALPFVMLDATLVYSGVRYIQNGFSNAYAPSLNPRLTPQEQTGVILTSVGICIGIGLTDLIINIVKRNNKKRNKIDDTPILILPIEEDPSAKKIDLSQEQKIKDIQEDEEKEILTEEDEIIIIGEDEN